jgi:preprotein translocase subunit SecE
VAKKTKAEAEIQDTPSGFNLTNFFQETKDELSKVVWPTRQQLISESAAVLLMVIASATLIYLVDNLFVWLSGQVFQ